VLLSGDQRGGRLGVAVIAAPFSDFASATFL
jgi:hypothetical protein